ncbi:hypothetical protein AB3G45_19595 [Shinella sp. S4-D37]|uniref:phage adaptor protein n=1 Tax=Shinella sp. S4-D37 TaxID=3161999 RepID=UPI003464ECEB
MTLSTYVDLQNTVQEYAIRPIPVASLIERAEADLQPVLKHYLMEKTIETNTALGTVPFPVDLVEFRTICVDGVVAKPISPYNAVLYPGEVGYYFSGSNVVLALQKQGPVDVVLDYYGRFEPLSDENPTNWLLTKFPSVYLHATLARAYRYLRDPEAEAGEKASLGDALGTVAADHARVTRSGNAIIMEGRPW